MSTSSKIHDRVMKLMIWTCRAEDATTREEAIKCLKKIARHSKKLAKLQSRGYN